MKILEICPFSAGVCGVWARVKQESEEFSKLGHNVVVFSSNREKETNKKEKSFEKIGNLEIFRFSTIKYPFSQNVMYFNFEKQLEMLNPDLVITHLLHPHSFKALRICNKLKIPIFLVTHAPFNLERKFPLNLMTRLWTLFLKFSLNRLNKIISITKWEIPYLEKLDIDKSKIEYIPNGIPEEFFNQKKSKEQNKILFLGRISPVKNLEILIEAAKKLPKLKFTFVGSAEKNYLEKIQKNLPKNIEIKEPIYNLNKKINLIDEHKIFVLPSKREAMPQSLIEAMARGKIVISSNTDGGKEIIENGKNGFLFDIGNSKQLINSIKKNIKGNKKIKENARKSVKKYSWKNLIKDYEKLSKQCYR